jgi:hypothetical protein
MIMGRLIKKKKAKRDKEENEKVARKVLEEEYRQLFTEPATSLGGKLNENAIHGRDMYGRTLRKR